MSESRILARWRGGELSQERFELLYDPEGKALARGGKVLRTEVCKAVFRDIYEARALASGLDRDPAVLADLAEWRTDTLARRYEERHYTSPVTDEGLRARYERDLAGKYTSPPNVSLDVLFVRCGLSAAERGVCRARMAELAGRLATGEPFESLIAGEKARSGAANGHFDAVPVNHLDPELAESALRLPPGEVSPAIESLPGFYRLRVTDRKPAAPIAFEAVAAAVRQEARQEASAAWREAEVARLRTEVPGLAPGAGADAVLAAAAVAEGLDRDAGFLARAADRRSWSLADAAFLRHREILPTDAQLAVTLSEQASRYRRYRLRLATLPAGREPALSLVEAETIVSALRVSANPVERLRALAATLPGLELDEVGPATADELRRRSPRLAEIVGPLTAGSWTGPEAVGWRRLPAGRTSSTPPVPERGLLFVAVAEASLPPLAEVREELLRQYRSRLGAGVDAFLAAMGPAWGVELLVP